jgi:hypothetical protein
LRTYSGWAAQVKDKDGENLPNLKDLAEKGE